MACCGWWGQVGVEGYFIFISSSFGPFLFVVSTAHLRCLFTPSPISDECRTSSRPVRSRVTSCVRRVPPSPSGCSARILILQALHTSLRILLTSFTPGSLPASQSTSLRCSSRRRGLPCA